MEAVEYVQKLGIEFQIAALHLPVQEFVQGYSAIYGVAVVSGDSWSENDINWSTYDILSVSNSCRFRSVDEQLRFHTS